MILVQNYTLAVLMCVLAMICWGSWQNTQNLAGKSWRFELFYWDFILGILLFSLVMAFTFGSMGTSGRDFITDLRQASAGNLFSACTGRGHLESGNPASCGGHFHCRYVRRLSHRGRYWLDPGHFHQLCRESGRQPLVFVWRITCHCICHIVQHDCIPAARLYTKKGSLQGYYVVLCCRSADCVLLPLCRFSYGYRICSCHRR